MRSANAKNDADGLLNNFRETLMKRLFLFLVGLAVTALTFGGLGLIVGYEIARGNEPKLRVRNLTHASIPRVNILTDVGESYFIADLPAETSRSLNISGRPKALWLTVTNNAGQTLKSDQLYVSSQGVVFGAVSETAISIDYEPLP
jgi:hypothetical protein